MINLTTGVSWDPNIRECAMKCARGPIILSNGNFYVESKPSRRKRRFHVECVKELVAKSVIAEIGRQGHTQENISTLIKNGTFGKLIQEFITENYTYVPPGNHPTSTFREQQHEHQFVTPVQQKKKSNNLIPFYFRF